MTDERFTTEIINSSPAFQKIWETSGLLLGSLPPGARTEMISCSRDTLLAPYASVEWLEDGSVELVPRDGFGADPAATEFLNAEGAPVEKLVLESGTSIWLTRGIPARVFLSPGDGELAKYRKVALRVQEKAFKHPAFSGFMYLDSVLVPVGTEPKTLAAEG